MRRLIGALGAILILAAGVPSVAAGPGPGGFTSDNVEYISTLPIHSDSAGGALLGKYFYITTERDLTIYDVSDPVDPQRVGFTLLVPPGQYYYPEENPETNGKVLLVGNAGSLAVVDVEDKTNPMVIGSVDGADEHTISCVLDCTWAYGSEGVIVDLRDPTNPEIAGDWTKVANVQQTHDVTEVAPGLVMTSSQPMFLLDAREDPVHPKIIASVAIKDDRFIHSNLWPRAAKDKFLLVGGESVGPFCDENSGAFMTFDATKWKKTKTFTMIDEYRVKNGLPTDGNAIVNQYCTHWFDTHPAYDNGGLVAMAWYDHGVRFLDVSDEGKIKEVGYFLPWAGQTSATYWLNDEIVYAADYQRGLDIVRFTGKP